MQQKNRRRHATLKYFQHLDLPQHKKNTQLGHVAHFENAPYEVEIILGKVGAWGWGCFGGKRGGGRGV